MFIKQAYEDRLKKEVKKKKKKNKKIKMNQCFQNSEATESLVHLHPKSQPKIGSIKNTRINYDKDEHFFSKDDVPARA